MEVLPLKPFGYCVGVTRAIAMAKKAKQNNPDSDVYLLGLLVHNETCMQELSSCGLIPLDEREKPLLDHLLDRKKGDVIVFSAHGHPESYLDLATEKGLTVIDATCPFVDENLKIARRSLDPVLYIGVAGHLESEAFLSNCPDATFYDVKSRRCNLLSLKGKTNKPLIISQTTLSKDEVEEAMADIRVFFPEAVITKERCDSTTLRQKAVLSLPDDVDYCVVLGSKRSNNSLKLLELAQKKTEASLCLGLTEVKELNFKGKKKVALVSGASTSGETFNEVLAYLLSLDD